ncbi:phosphatidate cytidylyltransferase [Xenorhabdus vietnamensis]|uniref:Cell division inhibitor SulA n=1 Tax=Xenorhabdus vietnamensis TaxID=351656 RepID=A0A1Y2SAM0_9GAMM|nr:SOS-induced cell division inhibitor SulA [Xenorhabdus vietnamensis]OTA14960.1 phosphatidate cytidylyltransferase [Xenorhabdus vietnamensis]
MSIQLAWKYLTEQKTTTANTTAKEHKTDEKMVGVTVKKLSFVEPSQYTSHTIKGMVSELVYSEHQPVINHILLPLLRQSGKEDRWLLWVNPNKRLNRQWLINAGLPLNKIVQLNQIRPIASIGAMEKALASGNYSIVLGWLPELSEYQLNTLELAAQKGATLGFIMRPQNLSHQFISQYNRLQIHSNYYH